MTFPIPTKALEAHLAILGKTGSGKTVAAKGMVEGLLDAGARCCAIDPTGVWYGLRLTESGKRAAYPVVIFGGPHADVQLSPNHGEAIAEIVGTSSTSAVIDTSAMRVSERTRFFADFGDALIRKNKGPLHLVIDEAHLFCPQGKVADPMSAQMLHAANNLVSLGRSRGLRITLISQRPAKVHKDSLTQVETLVAMRLIAPQDRNAVEAWIEDNADDKKGAEIIRSLAALKTGEAWLWAPEIGILERVKFPKNRTFDSSRAPDTNDGAVTLPAIDLATVHDRLTAIEAETKANDPKALKAEIARLKAELGNKAQASIDAAALQNAREEGFAEGWRKGKASAIVKAVEATAGVRRAVDDMASDIRAAVESLPPIPGKPCPAPVAQRIEHRVPDPKAARSTRAGSANGHDGLTTPQRRVLSSVGFWRNIGNSAPTREQVAAVAGYAPSTGNFNNIIGGLRTAGHLVIPQAGRVALTEDAPFDDLTPTEARDRLLSVFSAPQRKLVDAVANGDPMTREELASATGYTPGTGNFNNLIGSLCTIDVLRKPGPGVVQISDWAAEVLA